MNAEIINKSSESVTIQVTIHISDSMLSTEEAIQKGVNQAGLLATEYLYCVRSTRYALSQFDTDGTPIEVGEKRYTSKGQFSKTYQCPFGEFKLLRHVYQSGEGGSTYCPLDNDARILVYSTPKFSKMVSSKYSTQSVREVQTDLEENHGRTISRTYTRTSYAVQVFRT